MKPKKPFARKRFGQHFLKDLSIVDRMVFSADLSPDDHVIEIGPGRGVMTTSLLKTGVSVTAVEIDRDLASGLEGHFAGEERLKIITGDILQEDWSSIIQEGKRNKIIANLPYNISTPLFFRFVDYRESFHSITIMVQKELAERIRHTGEGKKLKDYGILSVIAGLLFDVRWICDVSADCFVPPPKVESAVIQLIPKDIKLEKQEEFYRFVRLAFNFRRKMLLPHLRKNEPELIAKMSEEELQKLEKIRPENLLPGQYLSLFRDGRV